MSDYKERTIESYDKNPEYHASRHKGLFDVHKRGEFARFLELVSSGAKVLDLGCGAGDHTAYFQDRGLEVMGIDLSEEMVRLARERGVYAEVMDIEDLKFEDNSFDGIWAVTSLLHIERERIPGVVKKLSGILKPEGILYTCVKEGVGEEFVPDENDETTGRRFVYWLEQGWHDQFGRKFVLSDFDRNPVGNTVFLESFFRNEK